MWVKIFATFLVPGNFVGPNIFGTITTLQQIGVRFWRK